MKWFIIILLCLVPPALTRLDKKQIRGLKALLKNSKKGMFPTCQIILFSELVDFDTAEKNCETFDMGTGTDVVGNLATVNDDDKNTDLQLLLNMAYKPDPADKWGDTQWVWAGLRKTQNNDGRRRNRKYKPEDWEWSDGSNPSTFHKWMKKQPDQATDGDNLQNQMRINHNGKWDDTYKYKTHPYACDYQGKYILSGRLKTWTEARWACNKAGLHLAFVRTDQEVEEMKKAAEYFLGPRWDTMHDFSSNDWLWLGATDKEVEGVWKWLDGSPVTFKNWRYPMPDNAQQIFRAGGQNVLAFSKWGEFDDSYDDKRRRRPFACQCPDT